MLDSLALLVITFIFMSLVSLIGLVLIYFVKNQALRQGLLYFLCIWGMIIAFCGVKSTPLYMSGRITICLALGALSASAILVNLFTKKEKSFQISRILVTVSVVAGMINTFMI